MSTLPVYVGIDVAKAELVVATPERQLCRVANGPDGIRDLLQHLRPLTIAAVVMESTGCYGREAAAMLSAAGYQVAIVQPGRVRAFAASLGIRAKTDPIDAQVIARFADAIKPRPTPPPATETVRLRALVDRRDQLIEMRKQEENRLESIADPLIAKELRASITRLKKAEKDYSKRIADCIKAHPDLQRLSDRLQEESGVGLQTAAALLAYCPELGRINRQRAAALAGLAPYDRSSGTHEAKRSIYGGRRRIRKALYLAAVSAARWSPWLKDIYTRLRAHGKCAKVALIACARKLLVRLNSLAAQVLGNQIQQEPQIIP
jgi:transposase